MFIKVVSVVSPPDDAPRLNYMKISFRRLDNELSPPARANAGDAGWDLCTRQAVSLKPGERKAAPTGLQVAIPEGYAGLVLPRSGHALKRGVGVVNSPGLIDSGYRGEIAVILINHGHEQVDFERGERVAQLVIIPIPAVEWDEVEVLPESTRGSGGFGSSGS